MNALTRWIKFLGIVPWLACSAHATDLSFTDVTTNTGINHLYTSATNTLAGAAAEYMDMTGGAVAEDFDGDGWIDLYVLQCRKSTNLLYMNQHNGTFVDDAAARGVALATDSVAAAAADYDNDGDIDICVTFLKSPPKLLVNQGTGTFTTVDLNVDALIDLELYTTPDRYASPSFGDLNNDGYLDLVVGMWKQDGHLLVYTNSGTQFHLRTDFAEFRRVFSPAFSDFNNDQRADIPTTSDYTNSKLLRGVAGALPVNVTTNSGAIATDENGMGCAFGDYDNDGDLDWFVTSIRDTNSPSAPGYGKTGNRLYKNDGHGIFSDATDEAGVRDGNWGWGAAFADLDNDGDLDIYHVNGWTYGYVIGIQFDLRFNNQPARLFENNGNGTFSEVAAAAGAADTGQGRGLVPFDYDNDGDTDLFIVNNQVLTMAGTNATRTPAPPTLLRNDSPATNHFLNATLAGTPPLHRNGIGSRVYIRIGTNTQVRELDASTGYHAHGPNRIAHFGLGTNTLVHEVRAEWLGGDATVLWNVPSNTTVSLPSPRASLSTNSLKPGQVLTANATNVPPLGTHREWVVDGVTNADPLNTAFYSGTNRELRLNIYDTNNAAILFSELRRVTVRTPNVAILNRTATNKWDILWSFDAGRTFKVQMSTNALGSWEDASTTQTAFGPLWFATVTSAAPSALFRILELAP